MDRVTCLAGIAPDRIALFANAFKAAGFPSLASVARLDVAELGALKPDMLACDVDDLASDSLEFLRQVRFVLPDCIIIVSTDRLSRAWSVECHCAGANGVLAKESTGAQLASGVRGAARSGCFTDPRFVAA